jgi:Dolichyl-phosphate-mannose-protein mannosyltransferase
MTMQTGAHHSSNDSSAEAAALAEPLAGAPANRKQAATRLWLWGVAIALCFGAWAMRTQGVYNVVDTDAARHAMNGVFLRDLILRGEFTNTMAYARNYYAHLPALSLPYHPPLLPMIEVVFYSLFGVSVFSARLAVAVTVAVSALALFGLVLKTHRSVWVASFSAITFLCLPQSLWLGSDVMLEFPALAFTLLAIYCLQPVDREYTVRRALCFAVLAGAAVWTKQLTVFLGALPFLYFALLRRWRLFLTPGIWVSSAVFSALVVALMSLSIPVNGAGINQAIPAAPIPMYLAYYRLIVRNTIYYATHYQGVTGPAGMILLAALPLAAAAVLLRRGRGGSDAQDEARAWPAFWKESALYVAWTLTSLGVLFVIRPYDTRYMFFTYPALLVLGYGSLFRLTRDMPGGRKIALAAASMVTLLAVVQFPHRTAFLHGPEEAARMLAPGRNLRILYCGGTDGDFILNYRIAHPGLDTTIISGDKLSKAVFDPPAFEQFAHDYGVNYVVVEDASGWQRPWRNFVDAPLSTMVLEKRFDLVSSSSRWNGSLQVYRFTNPSPQPKSDLAMRMFMIGGTMDFKLGH